MKELLQQALDALENPALPEPLIQYRATFATITGYTADQMRAHAAAVSAERDARIEALQTECDASNAEGIELTAQVAALREEVAEVLAQNIKCVFAVNEYNTAIKNLVAERDALRSARVAYANEFPLNADGEPDVGNIHANIRAMKERIRLLEDAAKVCEATYPEAHHTGCGYVIERFPQFAGGKDCAQAIRALEFKHHD